MTTLAELIDRHTVDVLAHLDREATVPILDGLQFQGDAAVIPAATSPANSSPIPAQGIPVVRGEAGGNTHLLLADGPATWAPGGTGLTLGVITIPEHAVAYLAHPEHGYLGIAPGTYKLRRQREQADEWRMVQD